MVISLVCMSFFIDVASAVRRTYRISFFLDVANSVRRSSYSQVNGDGSADSSYCTPLSPINAQLEDGSCLCCLSDMDSVTNKWSRHSDFILSSCFMTEDTSDGSGQRYVNKKGCTRACNMQVFCSAEEQRRYVWDLFAESSSKNNRCLGSLSKREYKRSGIVCGEDVLFRAVKESQKIPTDRFKNENSAAPSCQILEPLPKQIEAGDCICCREEINGIERGWSKSKKFILQYCLLGFRTVAKGAMHDGDCDLYCRSMQLDQSSSRCSSAIRMSYTTGYYSSNKNCLGKNVRAKIIGGAFNKVAKSIGIPAICAASKSYRIAKTEAVRTINKIKEELGQKVVKIQTAVASDSIAYNSSSSNWPINKRSKESGSSSSSNSWQTSDKASSKSWRTSDREENDSYSDEELFRKIDEALREADNSEAENTSYKSSSSNSERPIDRKRKGSGRRTEYKTNSGWSSDKASPYSDEESFRKFDEAPGWKGGGKGNRSSRRANKFRKRIGYAIKSVKPETKSEQAPVKPESERLEDEEKYIDKSVGLSYLTRYGKLSDERTFPYFHAREHKITRRVDGKYRLASPFEHICGGARGELDIKEGHDGPTQYLSFSNMGQFPHVLGDCKQPFDIGQRRVKTSEARVLEANGLVFDLSKKATAYKWCYEGGCAKTRNGEELCFQGARDIEPWPYKCAQRAFQIQIRRSWGAPSDDWWTKLNRKEIAESCVVWALRAREVLVLPDPAKIKKGSRKNGVAISSDRFPADRLCVTGFNDRCVTFNTTSFEVCCCNDREADGSASCESDICSIPHKS